MNTLSFKPLVANASISDLVILGEKMFGESRFAPLGYSVEKAKRYAFTVLTQPDYIGFGAFWGRELVGMIVGVCGEVLPFTTSTAAMEHLLYVRPDFRGHRSAIALIRSFIAEAKARGARDITFSNGTGYDFERVGKLFEYCGLKRVGGMYFIGD